MGIQGYWIRSLKIHELSRQQLPGAFISKLAGLMYSDRQVGLQISPSPAKKYKKYRSSFWRIHHPFILGWTTLPGRKNGEGKTRIFWRGGSRQDRPLWLRSDFLSFFLMGLGMDNSWLLLLLFLKKGIFYMNGFGVSNLLAQLKEIVLGSLKEYGNCKLSSPDIKTWKVRLPSCLCHLHDWKWANLQQRIHFYSTSVKHKEDYIFSDILW